MLKLRGQNVSVYEVETLKRVQEANDSLAEIGRVDFFYQMWDANRIQLVRLDLKGREEVIKTITLAQLLSENAKLRQQRGERRGQSSGGGASPDVAPVQTETDEEVEQVSAPMSIQEEYRRKLAALSNNCAALADTTRRLRYSQVLW